MKNSAYIRTAKGILSGYDLSVPKKVFLRKITVLQPEQGRADEGAPFFQDVFEADVVGSAGIDVIKDALCARLILMEADQAVALVGEQQGIAQ